LPIICDPSHICGKADLISAIAQEAMDLLFDGLMVEVHPDPPNAWSDAAQQLTPDQFIAMVEALEVSEEKSDSAAFMNRMTTLRESVDEVDGQMLELLAQRMAVVREMGRLKSEQHVSTLQPHRWQEILTDRIRRGAALNLSNDFVEQFMQSVHEEAIRQQEADRIDGAV